MPKLIVTAKKLNVRRVVPSFLPDPDSIVGTVGQNFVFEGEEVFHVPNPSLGKWYRDSNGHFYWGGGVAITGMPSPLLPAAAITAKPKSELIVKLGVDKIWSDGEEGERATVAILDSGIAINCKDLTKALAPSHLNTKNFVSGSTTIDDDFGHGSHCAGLIAARNIENVVGIAPKCKLYVGKIRDARTNPSVANMIAGIQWAAGLDLGSPQDVDVISMSSGSLLNIPNMQPVVEEALQRNKILVFAIGNRSPGGNPSGGFFPAACKGAVSVGAVDLNNNFLETNFQFENLTICSPGLDVNSYWINGDLHKGSGNSQSTAICAGVIALLVSKLKARNERNPPQRISELLMRSGTKVTPDGFRYRCLNPIELYRSII